MTSQIKGNSTVFATVYWGWHKNTSNVSIDPTDDRWIPSRRVNNAESIPISWRHHATIEYTGCFCVPVVRQLGRFSRIRRRFMCVDSLNCWWFAEVLAMSFPLGLDLCIGGCLWSSRISWILFQMGWSSILIIMYWFINVWIKCISLLLVYARKGYLGYCSSFKMLKKQS